MKTEHATREGLRDDLEDDLFRKSTMSFGEHLDELRGALVRSAVGLVVALLVAFPFADNVVLFVEQPLTRALARLEQARGQILWEKLSPETASLADLQRLGEERLVPRRLRVDPDSLRRALGISGDRRPTVGAAITKSPWGAGAWIDKGNVAQSLLAQTSADSASPAAKSVWSAIAEVEREELEALARQPVWGADESARLAEVLGKIAASSDLRQVPEIWKSRERLEYLQVQLLERIADATSDARRVDRNVLLLHALFPREIPLPRPSTVELTVWETSSARLQALNAPEPFMIWMKALFALAAVLASPWIFLQIWNFVAAGLYRHERRLVRIFVPVSLTLFFAGASLAFFFVFDPVLDFLLGFNLKMNIDMQPRLSDWMGFVLLLPLGFGISFQLPLVMLVLERLGMVTVETYLRQWRVAVMAIFVVSSVLTPADPMSLIFMAVPLTFLYFSGIWFCRFNHPQQSPVGTAMDP